MVATEGSTVYKRMAALILENFKVVTNRPEHRL